MEFNKELIERIAKNARLNLTESEIKEFLPELKEVLKNFSKLSELNTDNVNASFQPIEVKNIFREDKVEKCLSQKEALSNAKHKAEGYFKGPRAI